MIDEQIGLTERQMQIQALESRRDVIVGFLKSLNFKTDNITGIKKRDILITVSELLGIKAGNQVVSVSNDSILMATWESKISDKNFSKGIMKDISKIENKIKKESIKEKQK